MPLLERFDIALQWRGFELHPEIPPGGVDIDAILPRARVDAMHARLQEVAADLGVPFSPRRHAPSTKPALLLSELARAQGCLPQWRRLAMDAHWEHGLDLEDRDVLRDLAERAGMDPDAAMAFLDDPAGPRLLQDQRQRAQAWGVTGIPTWFLLPAGWEPGDALPKEGPRPVRVVGCQPREYVDQAARLAGAVRRSE